MPTLSHAIITNIGASYIDTYLNVPRKIAAVYSEENYKGEMTKVQLLFVRYIQIIGDNR